jgi:hypothetical protein
MGQGMGDRVHIEIERRVIWKPQTGERSERWIESRIRVEKN